MTKQTLTQNSPIRCPWAGTDPIYISYHDNEWGVPLHDDKKLFEMLILEGFQAGLSWITILKRREQFRLAFDNWNVKKIAAYTKADIEKRMQNTGIIRNRLKIEAAIKNAKGYLLAQKEFGSFDAFIWKFTEYKTIFPKKPYASLKEVPVKTELSDAMSKELKKRGFNFVGSVICYSFMQAVGMVDDHIENCFK